MRPTTNALNALGGATTLPAVAGAVIYIRVSTKEQTDNLSLPTQLRACEEYCRREGLDVLERFREKGESAKTADRTELQRLLAFCRTNEGRVHFVVVFNLTRFARDKYDRFALRSHLPEYSVRGNRGDFEPLIADTCSTACRRCFGSRAEFDATAAGAPGLPAARVRARRVLWTRPDRQLVEWASYGSKCRFAKARPEPDFR